MEPWGESLGESLRDEEENDDMARAVLPELCLAPSYVTDKNGTNAAHVLAVRTRSSGGDERAMKHAEAGSQIFTY